MRQRKYITTESDYDDVIDSIKAYCQPCFSLGFLSILQERIYQKNEPIAQDHDQWRQCLKCGDLVQLKDVKRESKIKGIIEIDESQGSLTLASTGRRNLNKKESRIKKHKKETERLLQDYGNDPDLKDMLDKGKQIV